MAIVETPYFKYKAITNGYMRFYLSNLSALDKE